MTHSATDTLSFHVLCFQQKISKVRCQTCTAGGRMSSHSVELQQSCHVPCS